MELGLFLKGLVVGFVVAAPAGPIAVMCLHRAIEEGRLSGIATGLGAALADTVFGAVAALGVGYVSDFIVNEQMPIRFIGGIVLCVMGLVTFLRKPRIGSFVDDHVTLIGAFATAFALTMTNPITILAFFAIFSALGVEHLVGQRLDAATLIVGLLGGATAWWMMLAIGAALFRDRFTDRGLIWVARVSGLVIVGFGVAALISGVARLATKA
jgi:threonine/homoserine/homoserine lactone efflux protein